MAETYETNYSVGVGYYFIELKVKLNIYLLVVIKS